MNSSDEPAPAAAGRGPLDRHDKTRPWPWTDHQTGMRHGGTRRVRHRTLILIRWMAIGGQIASLIIVHYALNFSLPLTQPLIVIGASVLINVMLMARRPRAGRLRDGEAFAYLAYDVVQLAVLLFFTGGLANPFAILILAPVTVSAAMLRRRATVGLAIIAVLSLTVIGFLHWPLPWSDAGLDLPRIYIVGIWVAIVLSTIFVASYVGSLTLEGRRMQDALDATHQALTREQRTAAVGALAAAAAHELGSPLATIAVTVKELTREPAVMELVGGDIDILQMEIDQCRDILAELGRGKDFDPDDPFSVLPVTALIAAAIAQNDDPTRNIRVTPVAEDDSAEPLIARSPEFIHGLGNIIHNAAQFASMNVEIDIVWSSSSIAITVHDDGPGFSQTLMDRIGEPYISTRTQDGEHMGLGLFIAETLLERTGAVLRFDNHPDGGARVELVWRRAQLEYMKE